MNLSKREFLKRLCAGGVGIASGVALGDEFVKTKNTLPPGSCGDPDNVWFGKHIFPLEHTMTDGPSCTLVNGKVMQPAREIAVFHETDVVVVGGGPAGFAAALAARRSGARVALLERAGSLGGLFTNGMVLIMLSTSCRQDGKFNLVTRGICEEFMLRAQKMGPYASTGSVDATRHWQPTVDPEAAKYLMDTMLVEAGVDVFFGCWGVDTIQIGSALQGVIFESKQGRNAVLAKQVVDCSGDADVLFQAGGDYRQITHSIGFITRLANLSSVPKANPKDAAGKKLSGFWPHSGREANADTGWFGNLGPKGNGLDVREVSAAEREHRKYWWERVAKMRETPGWEKVYIANTCSQIGPRATRLVKAQAIVDRAVYRQAVKPADCVGVFGQDGVHAAPLYVPYRQLLPVGVDNLVCAGRCLGAPDTIDTFRLICPCFVTGEAAGTAAALAVQKGVTPARLDVAALQRELTRKNVLI